MKSVTDYLHNLAPQTFPLRNNDNGTTGGSNYRDGVMNLGSLTDNVLRLVNPYAVRGRSPVLTAADYIHTASLDMLHCHDKRIPAVLRDFYKIALREKNREACVEMGAILHLYVRSLNRLTFYKDAIQLGTGMMASTTSKFVPFDRGVRAVSISMQDVFNDIAWNRESAAQTLEIGQSCENPYFRLCRVIFLEALIEYVGRDSTLFRQDEPDCEPTDVETVNSYLDVFAQRRSSSSSSTCHSSTMTRSDIDGDLTNSKNNDDTSSSTMAAAVSSDSNTVITSSSLLPLPQLPSVVQELSSSPQPLLPVSATIITDNDNNIAMATNRSSRSSSMSAPPSSSPIQRSNSDDKTITDVTVSSPPTVIASTLPTTPLATATIDNTAITNVMENMGSDNTVNTFIQLINELPATAAAADEHLLDALPLQQTNRRRSRKKRGLENDYTTTITTDSENGCNKRRTRRKRHNIDNDVTTVTASWIPSNAAHNNECEYDEDGEMASWMTLDKSNEDYNEDVYNLPSNNNDDGGGESDDDEQCAARELSW